MPREEDYIQQLANYIKANLSKGYTLESLKFALQAQEYSRSAIDRAIDLANEQLAKKAPAMKEKPVIKYDVVDKIPASKKKSFLDKIKEWLG